MIERVEINNFQSLRSVAVDLGRFTVIVGPSSSGKTAFMRALRAVASNIRGTHVITRGTTRMAVTVHTSTHKVTFERDLSAGRYRIATGDGAEQTFTKLAGGVPEAVTAAIGMEPVQAGGSSVSFAAQFDPPFLLGETGANVARTLGALTNVSAVLEAAREANRRRNSAAAELKTREAELARTTAQAARYTTLPARLAAQAEAELLAGRLSGLQARVSALQALCERIEQWEARARPVPAAGLPDTSRWLAALQRREQAKLVLRAWAAAEQALQQTSRRVEETTGALYRAENHLTDELAEAGVCPTCNQAVTSRNLLEESPLSPV